MNNTHTQSSNAIKRASRSIVERVVHLTPSLHLTPPHRKMRRRYKFVPVTSPDMLLPGVLIQLLDEQQITYLCTVAMVRSSMVHVTRKVMGMDEVWRIPLDSIPHMKPEVCAYRVVDSAGKRVLFNLPLGTAEHVVYFIGTEMGRFRSVIDDNGTVLIKGLRVMIDGEHISRTGEPVSDGSTLVVGSEEVGRLSFVTHTIDEVSAARALVSLNDRETAVAARETAVAARETSVAEREAKLATIVVMRETIAYLEAEILRLDGKRRRLI